MPNQGYTVSPVFTSGEAGEEQVVDFSISENRHGNNTDINDFSVDESHGIVSNNHQQEQPEEGGLLYDSVYEDAVKDAYPLLEQALTWAGKGGVDADFIERFNDVINAPDHPEFYPAIEGLIAQFQQSGARVQQPSPPRQQQERDVVTPQVPQQQQEEEFHSQVAESLSPIFNDANPALTEDYLDQAHDEQESGDYMGSMLSLGLAYFHKGEVTGEQVVDNMIQTFGQEKTFQFLSHVLELNPN